MVDRSQPAPLAGLQVRRQDEAAERLAVERLDAIAGGGDHALDLVVLAFGHRQAQMEVVDDLGRGGGNRYWLVVEHDAGEQVADLFPIERMLRRRQINLGHLALAGGELMVQLPVVGEQEQPGGVLVEATDRLHPALA